MAIVNGTSAAETLKGTPDDDVISGRGGDDTLIGGAGFDILNGGVGDDSLLGGGGDNLLIGGAGNDILKGGSGDDILLGGDGEDRLVGKVGLEFMDGGDGSDTYRLMPSVSGAAFQFSDSGAIGIDTIDATRILSLTLSDVFDAGSGIEAIDGNAVTRLVLAGSDAGVAWDFSQFTLLNVREIGAGAGDDAITGSDGDDKVKGRGGDDVLAGGDGDDVLAGGGGADMLDGGAGDDVLKGGGGDDVLVGGAGNDTLKGGNGDDTVVHDAGDGVRVDGGAGHDTLAFQGAGESLDLTQAAGVTHFGLEAVDLTGSGDNMLLLTRASLLALSATSDTLQVLGDAGDVVVTTSGEWLDGGEEELDGITFDVFTNGVATLQVQQGVTLVVNTEGNDAPVIVEGEVAAVTAGAIVTTGNVLDNGKDPDKDALVLDDFDATSAGGGNVTDNGDGTFDYDPGDAFDDLVDGQTATDTFTYTLSDGQGGTVTGTVTVTVTGVNDAPVITTSAALAVAENSTAVVTLAAADPDAGAELTWSISGGADAGLFAIDPETGELNFLLAPDFDAPGDVGGNNVYDVTVQVSDGALADTLALAVTVTDAPEVSGVGGTVPYTIGAVAEELIVGSPTVNDDDSTDLAGATISVINFQPGDVLHFIDAGAITHTYDANTGVLTLTGTDTLANYELALESVTFSTTSLVQADRSVEFTVNDGTNDSAPAPVTVDIAPSVDPSVLDGTSGFRIDAVDDGDFLNGPAVAGIGDINGDGYDDVIVGAHYADDGGNDAGAAYVVFGSAAAAGSALALSSLDGNNGFRIDGVAAYDQAGYRVAGGGDVNGDGIDDLVLSANNSGDVYVVFGDAGGFGSSLALATLDGSDGVRLVGEVGAGFRAEVSVAGDINGDGFADLVLGYYQSNLPFSVGGGAYVVFGASGFSATLELSSLNGSNGFQVVAEGTDGKLGKGVSGAGDVNGDGFDDVIVGAYNVGAGAAWVIHGKASGWGSEVALTGISGTSGFQLNGGAASDHAGISVADAGDVNGDGFADLLVGADFADTGASNAGNVYLVYGTGDNLSDLSLSTLNGSNGFVIVGENSDAKAGTTVDGAGDLDGDGYDDLLVGSSGGPTYVIFGSAAGPGATLDLSALDGADGFELNAGGAVAAAGDVNGDGFADLIVGSGSAYVIFGQDLRDQADFTGSAGNDDLTGTGADEIIHGGAGDDTLDGGGGNDALEGGTGSDVLIFDATDRSVDGGPGHDTLIVEGGGVTLDLTVPEPALTGIEVIDLTGSDDNTLVLDLGGVADLVGPGGTLRVLGNTGDAVDRDDGWSFTGLLVEDGETYRVFEQGSLTLEVALDVDLAQGVELALSSLSGNTGTPITSNTGVQFGAAVSTAGDMNGDGFADLIIGAPGTDVLATDAGAGYVFYGSAAGPGPENGLLNLTANDKVGTSVAGAGDVNGDGLADLIVGAPFADPNGSNSGASFVVFGNATLIGTLNLPLLNGSTGFKISGVAGGNQSGYSVSTAGDVNGDGYADLLVGAPKSSGFNGASYVVFGKASGFASNLNLSTLDGTNGFAISATEPNGYAGHSVSSAGDINGDGFDDVLIGAPYVLVGVYVDAAYVVFGAASGFNSNLALSDLDGNNGFRIPGEGGGDMLGRSVSGAGDVNGDGFDDIIIGRPGGGGGAYVVFGAGSGFTADLDLSTLDGSNGFLIEGGESTAGFYVSDAGDINGDGFGDLIVGGSGANVSYVIFGAATGFASSLDLGALDGTDGFRIRGDAGSSAVVSAAGDVNGDGYDDLLVGSKDDGSAGTAYLVYGADFRDEIDFTGTDGVDTLTGTGAAELMVAGRGADTVNAGGGADGVNGGAGADALNGEAGADRLEGGTGADTLDGGADNDRLFGDEGADTLDGGLGNDDLTGGMGNDTFLFNDTLGATNVDRILDFGGAGAAGLDIIHLDNAVFTALTEDVLSGAEFESGTDNVANAAATRIIYNTDTGALYYDADGSGGGSAAVQFAVLVGNPDGISAEDFLIV